jgi:hypothetical protein
VADFQGDDKRVLLYPSDNDSKVKLHANQVHALHQQNKYTVIPPFGTEIIMAFCSIHPRKDPNETDIGGGYRGYHNHLSTSDIISTKRAIDPSARYSTVNHSETTIFLTTIP